MATAIPVNTQGRLSGHFAKAPLDTTDRVWLLHGPGVHPWRGYDRV